MKDYEMNTEAMKQRLSQNMEVTELLRMASEGSLRGILNEWIGKRGVSVEALAELSLLNRASLYKILNGVTKQPKRNVLLRLCLTLRMGFEETQKVLKYGNQARLSSSRSRDIIVSEGIIQGRSIQDINAA